MKEELKPIQPATQNAPALHAQFFVMPDVYRHGKEAVMVEPKQEVKKPVVQPPPPPVPVAQPVAGKPVFAQPKPGMSKTTKALLIAGVIVLVALGIGGYLVVRSIQKQAEVKPIVTPVVTPKPPIVVPTPPVAEPTPPVPEVVSVVPGRDRDSDGLSDTEEQLVYGTNPNLPDTDADGFLDGNEVFHRYNPSGTAPGTLVESGRAKVLSQDGIQLVYPSLWTVGQRTNEGEPEFLQGLSFVSTTGEQIRVAISTFGLKPEDLLAAWRTTLKEEAIQSKSKAGYALFVSQDNLQAFIILSDRAVRVVYEPGTKTTVEYLQTFQMMINSVELVQTPL